MTDIFPILTSLASRCPSERVGVELALATIEEIDLLGNLQHLSREQIVREIINAALLSDTPHCPAGPDAVGRLAEHGYLTLVRSYEIARERRSEARSTAHSPESDAGSSRR